MNPYVPLVLSACMFFGQALFTVWFFRWRKREEIPEEFSRRLGRLEDAFIAHTGMTLGNGKSYRKGR